jgi:ankyrin repeat protein
MLNNDGYTPLDMCIMEANTEKAEFLIQRIKKFHANSNLRFIKKANRLDLKYEKALTLSIMKNNLKVVSAFPPKQIKTLLVSMSQVKNYNLYKQEKSIRNEVITSPMHLACKLSIDDAVRFLIEKQNFDVNMLLDERSCVYELLSSSSYIDFNILNYLLKVSRPDINSGTKIPLNQALLRGNVFIIKTLVEFGKPNFHVRDHNGLAPIHIAAQKLDLELFDSLVKKGADPNLPDDQGNTSLHMLCEGAVRDVEYDFIKECIEKFNIRLTRNKEHKTPFNLIRAYPKKTITARQGPNFRRKVWDYFEEKVKEQPDLEDADKNHEIHLAIIRG